MLSLVQQYCYAPEKNCKEKNCNKALFQILPLLICIHTHIHTHCELLNCSCLTIQNALDVTNTISDNIKHGLKQMLSIISDKNRWIINFTKQNKKLKKMLTKKKYKKEGSKGKLLKPQNLDIYLDSEPDEGSLR